MANESDVRRELLRIKCKYALKQIMEIRKINTKQLAEKAGIPAKTIEAYLSGRVCLTDAKAETLMDIAGALEVDPNVLIGRRSVDSVYDEIMPEDPFKRIADIMDRATK